MFCFFLRKFSFSEKESLLSIPKVFLNDPGIANYGRPAKFDEEVGKLMENVVFLELKRRKLKTFYWKDYQGCEVVKASELLRCKDLLVITWDFEGEEEVKGKRIKFLPLWKWLLRFTR